MKLSIDKNNNAVWEEQIYSQIKAGVESGEIAPGAVLPSISGLAKSLGIGMAFVQRAYVRLKREGIFVKNDGSGAVVAGGEAAPAEAVETTEVEI